MGIEKSEAEEARRKAVKEAAFAKAKQVFDEYEGLIEEQKQLRMLVERECGAQVKASNEAVVDNNAEIVRLNTMLEKAKNKEIKLSFREKSEMSRQLKERRANQETLMYEAIDLQEEFKQSIQLINDKIKALRQEQGEKEVRAKYSGQYLKQVIENILNSAVKPYRLKEVTDSHVDLRKIDSQKIEIILNQMVLNKELLCEENERKEKFYEFPKNKEERLAAEAKLAAEKAAAEEARKAEKARKESEAAQQAEKTDGQV